MVSLKVGEVQSFMGFVSRLSGKPFARRVGAGGEWDWVTDHNVL